MASEESKTAGEGKPLKVVLTGAAGNIAYALSFMISQGSMFGARKVALRLLDIEPCAQRMDAVAMELQDCASSVLAEVVATTDTETAFTGAEVALLVGARPRGKGMLRSDLLAANASIFEAQGKALDKFASKSVKVLVVGNPANTNALITMTNAPSIPRENFTALTRLDQNRATSMLAGMVGAPASSVGPVIIWGNHSSTQFPDARFTTVTRGSESVSIASALASSLGDAASAGRWLQNEFVHAVQQRGAAVIAKRGASSAGSAANAICDHVRDWFNGTNGRIVSMGVVTDGTVYGLPEGLIFSLPVTVAADGTYTVVSDLAVDSDEFARSMVEATTKELVNEKTIALATPGK